MARKKKWCMSMARKASRARMLTNWLMSDSCWVVCGIKDVGGGKTHLIADDRAAETDCGKNHLGHQADHDAQQHLVDDQ